MLDREKEERERERRRREEKREKGEVPLRLLQEDSKADFCKEGFPKEDLNSVYLTKADFCKEDSCKSTKEKNNNERFTFAFG